MILSMFILLSAITQIVQAQTMYCYAHETTPVINNKLIKSFDIIEDNILRVYPESVIKTVRLEKEYGRYLYMINVTDSNKKNWKMTYGATTGILLKNEQGD